MAWNDKYWDILSNLYWTPRYLGLRSISREKWQVDGDHVLIPKDLIANSSGPLYSRAMNFEETRSYLNGQEEILNQLFNVTFAIAADAVIARLFCKPLGISDEGPFESVGREIKARYGWRKSENVTQQDGLFVTPASVIGVELKLGSTSWAEQIAKYIALMIWEEEVSGPRANLGLLFIVPEPALPTHWQSVGLTEARMTPAFVEQLDKDKLPKKIQELFSTRADAVTSVLARLQLAVISWRDVQEQLAAIESEQDASTMGGQTLRRLLSGFRAQLEVHDQTGLTLSKERRGTSAGEAVV